MADTLELPESLAKPWRRLAGVYEIEPQLLLEAYVSHLLKWHKKPGGVEWRLGLLRTDDGPTPPAGLGRVLDAYPRWAVVVTGEDDEVAAAAEQVAHPDDVAIPEEPGCQPCVLQRDAVIVEIALIPGRQLRVTATSGERCEEVLLDLACHEVWADLGRRVWNRVMDTADQLADEVEASGEAGTPDEVSS